MSAISRDDLKIILRFGVHVGKVDSNLVAWEKRLLGRLTQAMQLSEAEKTVMVDKELSLRQGLAALSGTEAQTLLLKTLCAVAHSDGVTHEREVGFISRVLERLGSQVFLLPKEEWGEYESEVVEHFSRVLQSGT
jgi:tellurite resistance protein